MLVDTFMFYNELDVLELRLRTLEPYVDKFVIVEAEVNHVGGPKELFFEKNKERFENGFLASSTSSSGRRIVRQIRTHGLAKSFRGSAF